MEPTIYPDCIINPALPQFRVGIIGPPGSGKTTSALTFPNPVILDKDRKSPPGAKVIPFYDPAFERRYADNKMDTGGVRSALTNWLKKVGCNYPADVTFIMDSWTMWMNDFDVRGTDPVVQRAAYWSDKKAAFDGWMLHSDRIMFGVNLMNAFKALSQSFVINFHEQVERNEDGTPVGIKPLMKGQFADQAAGHITHFVRQVVVKDQYYWQIVAGDGFKPILPINFDRKNLIDNKYIKPTYEELVKRSTQ